MPIGSFIIATEPLSDELAHELSPHNRMIFDFKHFLNYFRLSDDNRLIFGGGQLSSLRMKKLYDKALKFSGEK